MVLTAFWILLSAWLCAAGWILSALHCLDAPGYLCALAVTVIFLLVFKKNWWPADGFQLPNWKKLWRRFQRPAPLIILIIAVLCLASGFYAAPENGDTNAYRIPRVLHWLAESRWHWIRTDDARQNIAGCGYEWLYAPIMLLTHGDRWIFLPNIVAYFLLPGMLFAFFRRMKMNSRVAWWWSWLLASGWCFTMQACSTDNDSLATVYVLAALMFALRARAEKKPGWLWLAILAAALLSSVKPTNLPLLLPCAAAIFASWRLLRSRPAVSMMVFIFAALASFIPAAFLNWQHTGSWKGYVPEAGPVIWWHWAAIELPSPFWGIIGNAFYLTVQNLLPPFFPWAPGWNHAMQQFLQTPLGSHFTAFEGFGRLNRSVSPVSAGLGLAVIFILAVSIFSARKSGRIISPASRPGIFYKCLVWLPWLSLLAFMAKVGACQSARYLAPYYPLLTLALLLRPGMPALVRRRWWQRLVLLMMTATLSFMIFERGRTFVPSSVFAKLQASQRPRFLKVLDDYYQTRLSVAAYQDFTARHSAGESVVGYATICGGLEPGMWRPWGHGRVERILPGDSPTWVRSRNLRYVFIEDSALLENHETIQQWLERFQATLVDQMTYTTSPGVPRTHLYFARLDSSPGQPVAPAVPAAESK